MFVHGEVTVREQKLKEHDVKGKFRLNVTAVRENRARCAAETHSQ